MEETSAAVNPLRAHQRIDVQGVPAQHLEQTRVVGISA